MTIPLMNLPLASFQQANPGFSGASAMNNIFQQMLQNQNQRTANQYQEPLLKQSLLKAQLENQKLAPQAQYSPQMTLAELAEKQAMAPYYQGMTKHALAGAQEALAQAGLIGAQANLLRQETPAEIAAKKLAVYQDPMLRRFAELQQAEQPGGIDQKYLSMLTSGENGTQPPAMNPNAYSGSTLQNWAMTGSPISPLQKMQMEAMGKGWQEEAKTGVTEYNKAQEAADSSADDARQMGNLIDQFREAYKDSKFTGPQLGVVPSSRMGTLVAPLHDFTAEQKADNAAQNMQQMILKLMKTNRLTNYELNFAGNLKLNRGMTPKSVEQIGDWLKAKSVRLGEQQDFLNSARANGVDVQTANSLWQKYNNERPVYDFHENKTNNEYENSWKDYLNPEAVMAIKTGQPYVPNLKSEKDIKHLTAQQLLLLKQKMSQ